MSYFDQAAAALREHANRSPSFAELVFRDSELARVERRMSENLMMISNPDSGDIVDAYAGACDEISDEIWAEENEEDGEPSDFEQHSVWNRAQLGL